MNQIGHTLTHHPKKILLIIFLITSYLFYYAFLSEDALEIDFSLEQMFPENDPEKEIYDNFRAKFDREDLSALMIYTPPNHPLDIDALNIVNDVVGQMKDIQNLSNCINLTSFPCNDDDEIDYDNLYIDDHRWNKYSKIAYFYGRSDSESDIDEVYIRVLRHPRENVQHKFKFSNIDSDDKKNNLNGKILKSNSVDNYIEYTLDISDYSDDFLCLDRVVEISSSGNEVDVGVNYTPYYMINGCAGSDSNQSINSLSHLEKERFEGGKDGVGGEPSERVFDFNVNRGRSTSTIYFSDCGYDGLCPGDENYKGADEGELDNKFNCEPFDCGVDGFCSEDYYSFYSLDRPDGYKYSGPDKGEGDYSGFDGKDEFGRVGYDFIFEDWNVNKVIFDLDEYYDCAENGVCSYEDFDFLNIYNPQDESFDCEIFNYSRSDGEKSVINNPLFGNALLSESGQVGGIFYTLDNRIKNMDERTIFFKKLDDIIAKNKEDYNWEWSDGGIPVIRTRYVELVNKERSTFIPLAFLVVTVILFFVFRNIKSIVLPIFTMSLTLVWVSALMAYLGITINIVSYLTYNLLMIIGCSNAIHIQMKYHEGLHCKYDKVKSLRNVISRMGGALFLTSFTTAIGFFSLCLTNIKLTKEFGMILGIGVFVMFVMMVVVLPLLLLLSKKPKKKDTLRLIKGGSYKFISWTYSTVVNYPKVIVGISLVVFIIVAIGLFKIDYNVSVLDDLKPTNKIYKDVESIEGNMGGVFPIEVILEYNEPISLDDKDILNTINNFKEDVSNIDKITSVAAFTDMLPKFLAKNQDLRETLKLQENLTFNSNHSDLYASMLGKLLADSIQRNQVLDNASLFITKDLKTVRFSGRMLNVKAQEAKNIKDEVSRLSDKYFGDKANVSVTGSTFLALKTADHLVYSLTNSFALAFLIIFVSMVILFRSFKLSLISILPNVIPLMLAAAVMGFQDIKLRPTTAMTFAIALGIAVDDTIHFLARLRQEFFKTNNMKSAIKNTLLTTGKAIISTTIVLSLGFAVLYFSELMPNHEFGILATIILMAALLGSIFLLPALLILFKPEISIGEKENTKLSN